MMESSEDSIRRCDKLAPEFISTEFLENKVKQESEPADSLLPMSNYVIDQQDIESSYKSIVKLEPSLPLRTSPHVVSCNEDFDEETEYTRQDLADATAGILLPLSMDQQDIESSYKSYVKLEPSAPLSTSPHFVSCNDNLDDETEYTRHDLAADPTGGSFSKDSLEREDSVDSQSDSKSTLLQEQRSDHISHLPGSSSAFQLEDVIRGEDQKDSNVNGDFKSDIGSSNSGVKRFRCLQCQRTYCRRGDLKAHQRSHTDEKKFPCNQCMKSFKCKATLHRHLKTHLAGTCDTCGKTFTSRKQLVCHLRIHDKQHACEECGKLCSSTSVLKQHLKTHTTENRFKCNKCERCFKYKHNLNDHLLKHPEFKGDASFERYQQQKQGGTCDTCGKTFFSRRKLVNHIKIHEVKQHECKQCGKVFTFNSRLNVHMKTHTAERKFKCSNCERSFKYMRNLKDHLLQHPEFRGDASFERYQQAHQGGTCDTCGKTFSSKPQLLHHLRIHNKQHACEECGKLYINKSELKNHLKSHTPERRFQCRDCDLSFTSQSSLTVHSQVHSAGFVCSICNVAYKSKAILRTHYAKHAAESKSFACLSCKRTFQRKVSLKNDFRSHSSSNPCHPIQCLQCSMSWNIFYRGATI